MTRQRPALRHWMRKERLAYADGARERVEVLWINPAAAARLAMTDLVYMAGAA